MKRSVSRFVVLAGLVGILAACNGQDVEDAMDPAPAVSATPGVGPAVPRRSFDDAGRLDGSVRLEGGAPGNRVIRMGSDPGCEAASEGEMVVDDRVVVSENGGVANAFVYLEGDLPRFEPPAEPVRIDQVGCVYRPRVVGVEVGQPVEVSNGDDVVHNVHARSSAGNGFNVGQPEAGMVFRFVPQAGEVMLHLACDLHRWMNAYIGIVPHSYFAVTASDGSFSIGNVPPGTYRLHAWHEEFGTRSETVEIVAGEAVQAELAFTVP